MNLSYGGTSSLCERCAHRLAIRPHPRATASAPTHARPGRTVGRKNDVPFRYRCTTRAASHVSSTIPNPKITNPASAANTFARVASSSRLIGGATSANTRNDLSHSSHSALSSRLSVDSHLSVSRPRHHSKSPRGSPCLHAASSRRTNSALSSSTCFGITITISAYKSPTFPSLVLIPCPLARSRVPLDVPGGTFKRDRPVRRRHIDFRPQRRLGQRHRHSHDQVQPVPAKMRMRRRPHRNQQIPRRPPIGRCFPLPPQANRLSVLDARRNLDRDRLGLVSPAAPAAGSPRRPSPPCEMAPRSRAEYSPPAAPPPSARFAAAAARPQTEIRPHRRS